MPRAMQQLRERAAAHLQQARKVGSALLEQGSDLLERVSYKETVTIDGQGPLQLVRQLGEGGFGFVYLARHTLSGDEFAVKRMLVQDRESAAMAKAEVELMQALQHPNIVRLLASSHGARANGQPGSEYLLLMEFAARGTLARWVTPTEEGEMPPAISEARLLACFLDTCKAVAFMHSRSPPLTHYDMKLENVLETSRGTCKLCDFGSASTRTFDAKASDRRARLDEEDRLSRYSTVRTCALAHARATHAHTHIRPTQRATHLALPRPWRRRHRRRPLPPPSKHTHTG